MWKRGSFEWYLDLKDKFFINLTRAIMHADCENLYKLSKIFPQMCMANKCNSWEETPLTGLLVTTNDNLSKCNDYDKIMSVRDEMNNGSFINYIFFSGHFVTFLAKAIYHADDENLNKIDIEYPQMVAAYEIGIDSPRFWNMCPDGFESNTYNSPPKTLEKTPH